MDQPTTFTDIETSFHSMPLTKYRIDPGLEKQWLETALADYELELNVALDYDSESESWSNKLDRPTSRILALMMYVSYLQRELSRVMALNGIYAKDIQVTGADGTKRVTKQELDSELSRVNVMLHKLKRNCFD